MILKLICICRFLCTHVCVCKCNMFCNKEVAADTLLFTEIKLKKKLKWNNRKIVGMKTPLKKQPQPLNTFFQFLVTEFSYSTAKNTFQIFLNTNLFMYMNSFWSRAPCKCCHCGQSMRVQTICAIRVRFCNFLHFFFHSFHIYLPHFPITINSLPHLNVNCHSNSCRLSV